MQDATLMGMMHRSRYLGGHPGGVAWSESSQGGADDQFHAEKGLSSVLSNLVDWHDVGMIQTSRRLGFHPEAADVILSGQFATQDQLHGHHPVEANLARLVNHTHPTAPDLAQQFIVTKPGGVRHDKSP